MEVALKEQIRERLFNEISNLQELANNFFVNDFQKEIWEDNYKFLYDSDIIDTFIRLAFTIFNPDKEWNKGKKLFIKLLERKISFGGRVVANVGTGIKGISFFNCFAMQRTLKPYDSLDGIYSDLYHAARVLKTEGGIGLDFSHIRPRGTYIKGIGVSTPGVVEYMRLFSKSAELITKGNPGEIIQYKEGMHKKKKIRKGAQIGILSIYHPSIEEFIESKSKPDNGLEFFNISVSITDEFMQAVLDDKDWDLWFPDIHFEKYDEEWDGDFKKWKSKGYPVVVYKTVKARELWLKILKNAYNRAEPGILFIDNANKYNNLLPIGMKYVNSNPCLTGDTEVVVWDGNPMKGSEIVTLEELVNRVKSGYIWYVLSFNIRTQRQEFKKVVWGDLTQENAPVYKIFTKKLKQIKATEEHLFAVWDNNEIIYKPVCNLKKGDILITDSSFSLDIIESIDYAGRENVYDINVEDNHNFYANGILVHNCGEIVMSSDTYVIDDVVMKGDICNLGHLNLVSFYDKEGGFNWDEFNECSYLLVDSLDRLIDLASYPFKELENAAKMRRKLGCGILGYGSLLMMMGLPYGSKRANEFTELLLKFYINNLYKASALLAKDKGTFELYNDKVFEEGGYINNGFLFDKTKELIRRYGLRNSALSTTAPTGNTGIFMGLVSGGVEPVFSLEYDRLVNVAYKVDEELKGYEYPEFWKGDWYETNDFYLADYNGEEVLLSKDGKYLIDKTRGLVKRVKCVDFGYQWCKTNLSEDEFENCENNGVFKTALELSVAEHLEPFIIFSKIIDQSVSKCVAKGTLIVTNKGIFPIEKLADTENIAPGTFVNVSGYYVLDENGNEQKIKSLYYDGIGKGVKIRFSNGYEVVTSLNHKFKTPNGWVSASELRVGDFILYRTDKIDTKIREYVKFPQIERPSNKYKKITLPEYVDEKVAKFIGCFLANGCTSQNSICIVEKDKEVGVVVTELMNYMFKEEKVVVDKRNGVVTHLIHSRYLAEFFREWLGSNAKDKRIPDEILRSPLSVQLAFLEGISLDGYIVKSKDCRYLVIYEGYSKDIAFGISAILSQIGVRYILTSRKVKNGRLSDRVYGVRCYPDDTFISPIEIHKTKYTVNNKRKFVYFPKDKTDEVIKGIGKGVKESYQRRSLRNSLNKSSFLEYQKLENLGLLDLVDTNLLGVKVTDIEFVDNVELYDIEVENTHSYLLNGFVSHNTINIPKDYPFEDFEDLFVRFWKEGGKGITVYREGSMTAVLETQKKENEIKKQQEEFYEIWKEHIENGIIVENVKLPQEYPMKGYEIRSEGKKWRFHVAFKDRAMKYPFAIFIQTNCKETNINTFNTLEVFEKLAIKEGIPEKWIEQTKEKIKGENNVNKIARFLALLLRHNVKISKITDALGTVDGLHAGSLIFRLKKFLETFIYETDVKLTCPQCNGCNVVRQEGCLVCQDCGYSKCG